MKDLFRQSTLYQLPKLDNTKLLISGNNLKGLMVLVPAEDFNADMKSFLTKILEAIHFEITNDIHLVQLQENTTIQLHKILTEFPSKQLISFGISPDRLSLNLSNKSGNLIQFSNHFILFYRKLSVINEDMQLKRALWNQLKQIFKL